MCENTVLIHARKRHYPIDLQTQIHSPENKRKKNGDFLHRVSDRDFLNDEEELLVI
jgi:hypothetical protein